MDCTYAAAYADLYRRHWWWRSREAILLRTIARLPLPRPARILDVGCGDGLFLPRLAEYGSAEGIETDPNTLRADNPLAGRIHRQPLGDPVYAGRCFDLITALDVVEHIEHDAQAVGQMIDMLSPGGFLLLTVPAFGHLWDHHDRINRHYRRYAAGQVRRLLDGRVRIVSVRYLFAGLYPLKLLVKALNGVRGRKVAQHGLPPGWINSAMQRWCLLEDRLLGPLRLPLGTSVMALARRVEGRG